MKRSRLATLAKLTLACTIFLLTTPALARIATITLKDGRTLTGEIVSENDKHVVVRISNIDTPIDRETIASIAEQQDIAEQFRQKRAELKDDDVDGRYELAKWLVVDLKDKDNELQRYEIARTELQSLSVQAPENNQVKLLLRVAEERIKLLQEPPATSNGTPPRTGDTRPDPATSGTGDAAAPSGDLPTEKLNAEQINLIKVYEVDLNSRPAPRVTVPQEVIESLLKDYAREASVPKGRAEQDALRRAPDVKKLEALFEARARPLYSKVTIHSDPTVLLKFRSTIQPRYVLNYCGTVDCHGGPKAGKLFLFRDLPDSTETAYTNFYILDAYRDDIGYMIDRQKPDLSLLIQYGMPRENATLRHPDVPGWKPMLLNERSAVLKELQSWVRELMPGVRYPISYKAPSLKAEEEDGAEAPEATVPPATNAP